MKALEVFPIRDNVSLHLFVRDTNKVTSLYLYTYIFSFLFIFPRLTMQRKMPKFYHFGCLDEEKRECLSGPAGGPRSGGQRWRPAAFPGSEELRVLGYSHSICSHHLANNSLKGQKTGSGKKNDMESHLLIIVLGEWKTEFLLWSNYSLVSLMKPNHEGFQCLADVSEA